MTNYVKQKFQWFFDMATSTTECQRIDISAGGNDIYTRLEPFFGAFKHFKLGAIKIRMVPAATLPVDPSGLSYEAGEQTVDPRDMFNPGLVRITNGEDIPSFTELSIDEKSYYATMLDKRWYKFRLQSGFRRTARPLFWDVGQVRQDMFPGSITNVPVADPPNTDIGHVTPVAGPDDLTATLYNDPVISSEFALYQTGKKTRMGWLPTDAYQAIPTTSMYEVGVNPIPEVPVITVILPKAYKTKMYYRVYVEESVMFKDPVAINPYLAQGVNYYRQPVDRYVVDQLRNNSPTQNTPVPSNMIAGGGYR